MPCYSVSKVSVKVEKMEPDLLKTALTKLGLSPRQAGDWIYFGANENYNIKDGGMNVRPSRDINEIKRAYSAEIVKSQAERYGWTLVETAPFEFELTKQS